MTLEWHMALSIYHFIPARITCSVSVTTNTRISFLTEKDFTLVESSDARSPTSLLSGYF